MAKDKSKSKSGVANRHLHARISYLQQAATYLTLLGHPDDQHVTCSSNMKDSDQALPNGVHATGGPKTAQKTAQEGTDTGTTPAIIPQSLPPSETVHHPPYTFNTSSTGGLPLHLATHLRQVAQKSQIRLQTDIKRSMCKRCSTVLVEGKTSRQRIENLSKGRQKAHADVLVILCGVCGAEKRFPTNARRQMRKSERLLVQST